MPRTSNFSRNHPYAVARGWVGPGFAAAALDSVSDGTTEVDNVRSILVAGGVVTDLDNGEVKISFGGLSQGSNSVGGGGSGGFGISSATPVHMLNNSTIDLIPGDVVVVDDTHDSAVTTTSTASNTRIAGVVQAPIARFTYGPVLFNGLSTIINTTGTVNRGDYALTSTTAGLADSTNDRVAGSFGVYLTGSGDFPNFVNASANTEYGTPTTYLSPNMPANIPAGHVLFLALWLDAAASSPTVSGWTRVGSESGFYYFYKVSEGGDTATATWAGASVATASVLLLDVNVSLSAPISSHDYDSSTSAAAVSGLSAAPRYAVAGVQAVATPGSGFVRLAGGGTNFSSSGGAPSLVQSKVGYGGAGVSTVSFNSAVTVGNTVITIPFKGNDWSTWSTDSRQGGTCPVDSNMVQFGGEYSHTAPTPDGNNTLAVLGKVAADSYAGPYGTPAGCDSSVWALGLLEFENLGVSGYEVATDYGAGSADIDLGTFTVGANDVVVMAIMYRATDGNNGFDPLISVNGFTQVYDNVILNGASSWGWIGYKIGDGDASVTAGDFYADQHWAAVAVHLTQGGSAASGTLAGKYIANASSATSPFSGASAQNDAIFAFNLQQSSKPAVLLYGPDLGGGGGGPVATTLDNLSDVTITSPAEDDTLRYVGGVWVNDNRRWEPVTSNPGTGPEIVFSGDDIVMTWAEY